MRGFVILVNWWLKKDNKMIVDGFKLRFKVFGIL